jgi:HD-GYP domain-containing protein (c-di-GMP phosphodiesterase class II)
MDASTNRVNALQQTIAEGAYDVEPRDIAEAIVRRLAEAPRFEIFGDPVEDEIAGSHEPRLTLAPARPSAEELARAQLNRYAIDLRHSYQRELKRATELEEQSVATVRALATAVAGRDDDTGNHIQRVHDLGLLLARQVVPEEADDPELAYGYILHDIGKLSVPDSVLRKPGPLDEEEWNVMRTHPEAGARMLEPLPFLSKAREVVLYHHERWDGRGYPYGLAGEEIPVWARIFSVVDAVDSMTSDRPYRAGQPLEAAIAEVARESGAQFDPRCVEAFLALDRRQVAETLRPARENRLQVFAA